MLDHVRLENALVFDIETVPMVGEWADLREDMRDLWALKARNLKYREDESEEPELAFGERAGVFAEFGKIVCISAGFFRKDPETGKWGFRVTSFASHNERELLDGFCGLLNSHFNDINRHYLVGHNLSEFDIPYTCRRMLVNSITLPCLLDLAGKKPWEVKHIDTMQYWKFGDYKSFTSLKLLAAIFNIPTPKDDIEGKDVARVYWQDNDLERITTYCQKDVVTTARLLQKYKGLDILADEDVQIV